MSIGLLLDEMVEHEVLYRLRDYGHRTEHVHFHESLPDGVDDDRLAEYSLENDVLIVTYDDDFEACYTESEYWGVLLFSDDDW